MAAEMREGLSPPADITVGERLKVPGASHPLSDIDQGQRPGHEAARAAMGRAAAVRSATCDCPAPVGQPCTPTGDHLARYLKAEQAGAISREALKGVIGELDVFSRRTLIQPSLGAVAQVASTARLDIGVREATEREAGL